MRVLHLTTEFPPIIYGGLGTAVGGLVAASSQAGIETAVLLVGAGGDPSYQRPTSTDSGRRTSRPFDHLLVSMCIRSLTRTPSAMPCV